MSRSNELQSLLVLLEHLGQDIRCLVPLSLVDLERRRIAGLAVPASLSVHGLILLPIYVSESIVKQRVVHHLRFDREVCPTGLD